MAARLYSRIRYSHHNGLDHYTIEQRHFAFKWMWVSAWVNSIHGAMCQDTFYSLEDTLINLRYFR